MLPFYMSDLLRRVIENGSTMQQKRPEKKQNRANLQQEAGGRLSAVSVMQREENGR